MALRKNNQKDYDKFNDTTIDVLGNKREQDPPSKVTGENTGKISKDKQGKDFALVLDDTESGLMKGDTIRPGRAPRVDDYIMGGDYKIKKKSDRNYEID